MQFELTKMLISANVLYVFPFTSFTFCRSAIAKLFKLFKLRKKLVFNVKLNK